MVARRTFFRSASALALALALALAGAGAGATPGAVMRELVRCATLAPSSHNTQCWKFRLASRSVAIRPDFARRCPVVDPDDHHLFASERNHPQQWIEAGRAPARGRRPAGRRA